MPQPNPNVSTRIPPDWKIRIDAIASASGRNTSQVVHEALAQYLAVTDAATIGNQLLGILARLEAVERQQQGIKMLLSK